MRANSASLSVTMVQPQGYNSDPDLFDLLTPIFLPPFLPPSRPAEAFFGSSRPSSICPVAIRMTWTALPMTSAGRFWPWGPLGTGVAQP